MLSSVFFVVVVVNLSISKVIQNFLLVNPGVLNWACTSE